MSAVERVHVIFKTHLDIGFTHLAAQVIKLYTEQFIPKAIALAEQLEAQGGPERFVWTTGSWLIHHALRVSSEQQKQELEQAIAKGHIVWHGLPLTTHTELLDRDLLRFGLSIGRGLDEKYGKRTIAAKMTDVPGHTLAMVPILQEAGIQYLHLGVNPASKRPNVPSLFRWRSEDGSEVIVNYAGNYGEPVEVDGLGDVLVFAHTGDNCGPPSADEIRKQFADIARQYPHADIRASTLDAFAQRLAQVRDRLPVVREEIGDTWIHGAATDPLKLAKLRELQRLRSQWVASGALDESSEAYRGMSEAMLLTAEHTWGLDLKKWLPDFNHYSKQQFQEARRQDLVDVHGIPAKFGYIGAFAMDEFDRQSQGLFQENSGVRSYSMMERSWEEQRAYLDEAAAALDEERKREVAAAIAALQPTRSKGTNARQGRIREPIRRGNYEIMFAENGALVCLTDKNGKAWVAESAPFGAFVYETFGPEDYARYARDYSENLPVNHVWADADFGKPGIEYARPFPEHRDYVPVVDELLLSEDAAADRCLLRLRMPAESSERYGAPRELEIAYSFYHSDGAIEVELNWFGKDANRLPEASWFSFGLAVDNPNLWRMDKLGMPISPLHVVKNGNRNLHAVGTGVVYEGTDGAVALESLDAALAAPGARRLLQFDHSFASLSQGWHFNLHNNIWGTNFPMWYGEDAKFRFRLRLNDTAKPEEGQRPHGRQRTETAQVSVRKPAPPRSEFGSSMSSKLREALRE